MFINRLGRVAISFLMAVMCIFLAVSQPAKAEEFTSAEFLKWEEDSQNFFIEASVGMAASIASQIKDKAEQASCIDRWYYPDQNEKNAFIRQIMQKNSEYHPRAIIIGVLEKQCGDF